MLFWEARQSWTCQNALLVVTQIAISFAEWKASQGDRFVRSCMRDAFKVCGAEEFNVEKCQRMNGSLDNDIWESKRTRSTQIEFESLLVTP